MPGADLRDVGWVMWAGTIGLDSPVAARIEAALAAGCQRVSVGPPDFLDPALPPIEIGRAVKEAGLGLVIDPIMGWCGPESIPGPYGAFSSEELLAIAAEIGAAALTALGPFQPGIGRREVERAFARLCDQAAEFGAQVQLEFMPGTATVDITGAIEVVEGADRGNGGILFDTFHFFRGNPDMGALGDVAGERLFAVQVSDAPAEFDGDYAEATFQRLLPGEGAIDLEGILGALDRLGGLRWVGAEVISPRTAAMAPTEAAVEATSRVRRIVQAVRSDPAAV